MTPKPPPTIEDGQRWTFVHPDDGKRVDYVIEWSETGETAERLCKIVNAATGGAGWVTKFWLRRAPGWRAGHFEYAGPAA